jgi:uncharacterized protein DUF4265
MGHDLVKIVFVLDPSDWHGTAGERLWAERVGEHRFRLRNSPFFAFGVSNEDVVFGEARDGAIYFAGISIRGGHSTYRLRISSRDIGASSFKDAWAPLESLGCTFEEGSVLSVDVPPSADIYAVYELLEKGLAAGVWDFEEGHCGHILHGTETTA